MKALLIAEKPSLMRDIQAVYNHMSHPDQIDFTALAGHVVELKSPEDYKAEWGKPWRTEVLPMVPQTFQYEPKKNTYDLFKKARDMIKNGNYDYVINACDAGREGELIFYAFYKTIGCKLPVKRLWASDTTEATLKKAMENLLDDKEPSLTRLKASSQYRAYFDWLMGMNLSRAITLKTNKLIPVGRVMTPTLAIVVNRELEIQNFVPKDYWLLQGIFGDYSGVWFDEKTGETKFFDKDKAEKLKSSLGKEGVVDFVEKKRNKRNAPTLHSLLELQKEANKAFGYPADKTLAIAQTLYETKKLLSYPRTESRFLPKNLAKEVPNRLKALQGIDEVKDYVTGILADKKRMDETLNSKKYVDDKKVTDHHAIIPTDTKPNMVSLTKEEKNVYMLVVKRLLAIFLDAYETDKTTIITKVDNELFKTTGTTVAKLGYMELYKSESKKKSDDEDGNVLPVVKKGQKVPVTKVSLLKKETTAPTRYDDASILQAMANAGGFIDDDELQNILKETAGLGTSATRSGILTKLVDRQMIGRKGKSLYATQFGIDIIQTLNGKDITSPELTAKWEIKLSQIEDGSYDPRDFYKEMISYTENETTNYLNSINRTITQIDESKVVGDCPKCKATVTEGKSFYVCKSYKDTCDFILPKEFGGAKLTKTEVKKLLAGKETKEFSFKWNSGKTGTGKLVLTNEGKIGFANNNGGSSKGANSSRDSEKKSLGSCPKCSKTVVESKNYFLCENYKNPCDFIIGKDIKGTSVTATDVKAILSGKETKEKEFPWGKRKLKWNKAENKLDFVNA